MNRQHRRVRAVVFLLAVITGCLTASHVGRSVFGQMIPSVSDLIGGVFRADSAVSQSVYAGPLGELVSIVEDRPSPTISIVPGATVLSGGSLGIPMVALERPAGISI